MPHMKNTRSPIDEQDATELDAYNAAFHELGLPWLWNEQTWLALKRHGDDHVARVRDYLEAHHPHLLRAYDAPFLADVIRARMSNFRCEYRP